MNQTDCRYTRPFLIAVLTSAFLIWSEAPLLANPQQSEQAQTSQSSSSQSSSSQSSSTQSSSGQASGQSSSGQSSSGQSSGAQPSPDHANTTMQTIDDPLPDAPGPLSAETPQQSPQTPSGAAGAKAVNVKGAPVAQPVGAAVAPVRQRGHRSLLIKIGLLAGAGVAIGTVVALSAKSPTRPPGTVGSATHP
jgi:cytoskeletal protein RodZ